MVRCLLWHVWVRANDLNREFLTICGGKENKNATLGSWLGRASVFTVRLLSLFSFSFFSWYFVCWSNLLFFSLSLSVSHNLSPLWPLLFVPVWSGFSHSLSFPPPPCLSLSPSFYFPPASSLHPSARWRGGCHHGESAFAGQLVLGSQVELKQHE